MLEGVPDKSRPPPADLIRRGAAMGPRKVGVGTVRLALSAAVLALFAGGLARADARPTLDEAVGLYQAMDDARAAEAFMKVLAASPPGEVAAKAHLYLGLIAFNAFHPDAARAEFMKAILANPAIDLPPGVAPKTRISFAEAHRAVARELEATDLPPSPHPALGPPPSVVVISNPPAPTAAVTAPTPTQSGGIPAGTWWLGGFGVAALGAGTVLGVLSNNTRSLDSGQSGTTFHTISFADAQTEGYEALSADVLFGVGGALLVSAIIWGIVGSGSASGSGSSSAPDAPASASPAAVAF